VGKTRGRRKRDALSPGGHPEREHTTPLPDLEGENRAITSIPNTGDMPGEPILSPANSNGDAQFFNQDIWGVSQSLSDEAILGTMPELPPMDFLLDYSERGTSPHENVKSPWKGPNVEKHAPQPLRLDSAIDLSDPSSTSPTQQPIRGTGNNGHTSTCISGGVNTQRTPGTPHRYAVPMVKFPFRSGRLPSASKGVVVAAAEIVEQLESKMCAGLLAIDEVLRINKEATQNISELINRTDYISSIGSSIVVVAAAHHVVSLFENACSDLYSHNSSDRRSMSSRMDETQHSSLAFGDTRRRLPGGTARSANGVFPAPGIGFGSFLLDPQEQAALGAQIISTELHRSLRMVQSLSMPLQTGCFGPDPAGAAVDGWLQDLKQRLRTLISAVENSDRLWSR
jgi:hypothetical protein